jgi:uncharacterized protein YdgA (DUF945 family)
MRPWLVAVIVLGLVALGAAWFLSAFERVPSREWIGPAAECGW